MDDLDRSVLQRVPLAEATLLLLSHVTRESFLDDLYERNRGRCYEKVLSFSTLVHLLQDALIQYQGSDRKSCDHAAERDAMPVTTSAIYRRLGRVPLAVSHALLSETATWIAPLSPARDSSPIPASLRGMVLLPVDGKKIKNVAKRAKFLRDLPGAVLGAKVLVALRLEDGLAVALEANLDGEAVMTVMETALVELTRPMTDEQARSQITQLLSLTWSNRWLKTPPEKKASPRKKTTKSGAHTSVLRAKKAYEQQKARRERRRRTSK